MKKITVSILTTLLMLSMVFSSSVFAAEKEQSAWDSFLGLFSAKTAATSDVGVEYRGHIQNVGNYPLDGSWIQGPTRLGTVGQSLRLEGFWIKLTNKPADVNIQYQVHVQNVGWMDPVDNGEFAGTEGRSLQIEAIKISLVDDNGNPVKGYSVEYRGHVQNIGDTVWYKDGAQLGTDGQFLRLEALEVKIVKTQTDMTAYNAAVEAAEAVDEADYTADSYAALQKALEDNVVTVNNTQAEVDAATAAINAAIDALVPIGEAGLTVTTVMAGAQSVAQGQDLVTIGSVTLTAKSAPVTVTGLKVNRTGLSADSDIANISAWDGATRLNVPNIFSNGVANLGFTSNLVIPANTSKTIDIKANISGTAVTASQIVLSLKDKTAIVTTTPVSGTFPASTGTLTVASVSLGTLTATSTADTASGNIYPGKAGEQSFAKFRFAANGEGVKLTTITLNQAGTASDSDIKDLKLYNAAGVQVGATANVTNRNVTFNVSDANIIIANGASTTFEVKGTVNGSAAGRSVKIDIADATDVQGIGQTYGTTITGSTVTTTNTLTAATGAMNVALDTTNPAAATVGPNSASKFMAVKVQALNEPVQLRTVRLQATTTGASVPSGLSKVTLKIGDTVIGQVENFFTGGSPANAQMTLTNPITVKAGESVVIDVYGTTAATTGTYRVGLFTAANTISGVGTVSGTTVNVNSGAQGNIMTIGTQNTTTNMAANTGATIFANQINKEMGTINISHNLPKTVNVSQVNVNLTTTNLLSKLTNLRLVNAEGTTVSNTIGIPSVTLAGANNALTLTTPIAIAQGATLGLKVVADVNDTATAGHTITVAAGTVVAVTAVDGETVNAAAPGATTFVGTVGNTVATGNLTGAASVPNLTAGNVAAGATGAEVARGTLTLATSGEPVLLNKININATFSNADLIPKVSNYIIKDGGGNVLATVASLASGDNIIDLTTPLTIEPGATKTQQVKVYADIASDAPGGRILTVAIGSNGTDNYFYTGKYTGTSVLTNDSEVTPVPFTIAASKVSVTANVLAANELAIAAVGPGQVLGSFTFKNEGTSSIILTNVRLEDVLGSDIGAISSGNALAVATVQLRDSDFAVKGVSGVLTTATAIDVDMTTVENIVLAAGESKTFYATLSGVPTTPAIAVGDASRLSVVAGNAAAGTTYTTTNVGSATYAVNNSVTSPTTVTWK